MKNMIKKILKFKKENKETISESKDLAKELSATYTSNVPEYLNKNRNKIFDAITQYNKGEISKDAVKRILCAGVLILNCITNEEREDIIKACLEVELDIKKESDFTTVEYDIYREIIEYIHTNRQEKIKILLKKAAQKINNQELSISKRTIDFITSITDEELEILKKIFRYVVGNGIFKYKDIEQDFMKMGFCQSGSDNIKFLGDIFFNQDAIGGKAYIKKIEAIIIENIFIWKDSIQLDGTTATEECLKKYLSNEENKKRFQKFLENDFKYILLDKGKIKFHITKQPTSAGIIELNMDCFIILSDVGVEIYSLLKDEIENYPTEYLEAVINDEQYKNFGLVYEKTV